MAALNQSLMAQLGSATLCVERGYLGAVLRDRAIGFPHIVEDPEAHPFEVGNAGHQQVFGPDDAARIEAFHREEKNTSAKLGQARVPDRDGEMSRDAPSPSRREHII
jgi:hypothetical protein